MPLNTLSYIVFFSSENKNLPKNQERVISLVENLNSLKFVLIAM